MAEWKKEVARLARDFNIAREEILDIFRKVERVYADKKIPDFYNGNRNEFLYDKVQREIMDKVFA